MNVQLSIRVAELAQLRLESERLAAQVKNARERFESSNATSLQMAQDAAVAVTNAETALRYDA